jgi:hypothetical protein
LRVPRRSDEVASHAQTQTATRPSFLTLPARKGSCNWQVQGACFTEARSVVSPSQSTRDARVPHFHRRSSRRGQGAIRTAGGRSTPPRERSLAGRGDCLRPFPPSPTGKLPTHELRRCLLRPNTSSSRPTPLPWHS